MQYVGNKCAEGVRLYEINCFSFSTANLFSGGVGPIGMTPSKSSLSYLILEGRDSYCSRKRQNKSDIGICFEMKSSEPALKEAVL
jgi:hypothetical protein